LQLNLTGLDYLGGVGQDLHAITNGVEAGGGQPLAPFLLHHANAAGPERHKALVVAESGNLNPGFLGGLHNHGAGWNCDLNPIDCQRNHRFLIPLFFTTENPEIKLKTNFEIQNTERIKFDDLVKSQKSRHSCESSPPQADRTASINWIPAFAGMTKMGQKGLFTKPSNFKI
jgi:hypothetical protein